MVSFVHHMPHRVGFRDDDAPTRWGLLMAYRTPDPDEAETARWNEGVPVHWAERQEAGAGSRNRCAGSSRETTRRLRRRRTT